MTRNRRAEQIGTGRSWKGLGGSAVHQKRSSYTSTHRSGRARSSGRPRPIPRRRQTMPAATAQAAEAIGSAEAKPCARDGERSKKRTGPARCRTPGGQAVSAASDSSESSDARDQAACDVSSPGGPRPGTPRRERSRLKGQEGRRPGGFRPVEGRRLRKPWRGRNPGIKVGDRKA